MKQLFRELSVQLDALSHLSLTPKPVLTDLEVHADMPAIAMEEAAPVATSLAAMQAPEEAHAKVWCFAEQLLHRVNDVCFLRCLFLFRFTQLPLLHYGSRATV